MNRKILICQEKNSALHSIKREEKWTITRFLVLNIICNQRNRNVNIEITLFTYKAGNNYFSF